MMSKICVSSKDSNPRTKAKVIGSRIDIVNKSLVARRMYTEQCSPKDLGLITVSANRAVQKIWV